MEAKIRKYQHTLFIAGYAIILSGIWDAVKLILNLTISQSLYELVDQQAPAYTHEIKILSTIFAGICLFFIITVMMSIRITIGRTAIRLGMGEETRYGAMVFWSVILLLTSASGVAISIIGVTHGENPVNMASSFLIDLTTFFLMAGILTALYKLKKLLRQSGG